MKNHPSLQRSVDLNKNPASTFIREMLKKVTKALDHRIMYFNGVINCNSSKKSWTNSSNYVQIKVANLWFTFYQTLSKFVSVTPKKEWFDYLSSLPSLML